jgi:hypothetical protein
MRQSCWRLKQLTFGPEVGFFVGISGAAGRGGIDVIFCVLYSGNVQASGIESVPGSAWMQEGQGSMGLSGFDRRQSNGE